jgi:AcrR family transcriptional regulator
MIHIMKEQRNYHSPLRQEQAKRTREQILDGCLRFIARDGIADLSIPGVAREAGVSVPTIYRYFRTKRELVEALNSYVLQKANIKPPPLPRNPEDLIAGVKELFVKYEQLDETLRAAAMSEFSHKMRKEVLQQRLDIIEGALAPVADSFNEADRIYLRNIVFILTTTAMARTFADYLGLSGAEAADTVAWAIRMLTRASPESYKFVDQPPP